MNKIFIIAEAGVNHNGNIETAKKLVDAAVLISTSRLRTSELTRRRHSLPSANRNQI